MPVPEIPSGKIVEILSGFRRETGDESKERGGSCVQPYRALVQEIVKNDPDLLSVEVLRRAKGGRLSRGHDGALRAVDRVGAAGHDRGRDALGGAARRVFAARLR
jgi:hypothetical protein